jgi:hypothetical protein
MALIIIQSFPYLTLVSHINVLMPIKHGGGERCLHGFGWEARRQETAGKT